MIEGLKIYNRDLLLSLYECDLEKLKDIYFQVDKEEQYNGIGDYDA